MTMLKRTVLVVLTAMSIPLFAGRNSSRQLPWMSRSAFWQPYTYDDGVSALYHLDKVSTSAKPAINLDSLLDDDKAEPEEKMALTEESTGSSRTAANANPTGAQGILEGKCTFTGEGKFAGCIRLSGGDAVFISNGLNGKQDFLNIEFWLKLDSLPSEQSGLIRILSPGKKRPNQYKWKEYNSKLGGCTLYLKHDGHLQLQWFGKSHELPGITLPVGQWCHIAFSLTAIKPEGPSLRVFVDGAEKASLPLPKEQISLLSHDARTAWIGNDQTRALGLKGCIDEVRFSANLLAFYEHQIPDSKGAHKKSPSTGPPYFRDQADLVFYLNFDRTLKPVVAAPGTVSPDFSFTPQDEELNPAKYRRLFPQGVSKEGLLLGSGSLNPLYQGKGNLFTEQGTISFWLHPLNWDNFVLLRHFDKMDKLFFGIFQVIGDYAENSYHRKFHKSGEIMEFDINMNRLRGEDVVKPVQFHPGAWRHILVTWKRDQFHYYVDGKRKDELKSYQLQLPGGEAMKNEQPRWWNETVPRAIRFGLKKYAELETPKPNSVIDEFRVYKRVLSPSEIENLYAMFATGRTMETLPPIDLTATLNGATGELKLKLIPMMQEWRKAAKAKAALKKGTQALVDRVFELKPGQEDYSLPVPTIDFGTYGLAVSVLDQDDHLLGTVTKELQWEKPPWWQSQAGKSDLVLPPYQPVNVDGNKVSVWGRTFEFANNGLITNIISLKKSILTGPMQLRISQDHNVLKPKAGKLSVVAQKQDHVVLQAAADYGSFNLVTSIKVEFDGFIWYDFDLVPRPGKETTIDTLTVTLPYKPENATMVKWKCGEHYNNPNHKYSGDLPEGSGIVMRSNDSRWARAKHLRGSFIPYVALTGMKRGLCWCAENDKGWTQSMEIPAVAIERTDESVNLILNIIASPVKLSKKRTFSFGLLPLPTKAPDKNWRMQSDWCVIADSFCGNNLKGGIGTSSFTMYPIDGWDAVKRRIAGEGVAEHGEVGLESQYEKRKRFFKDRFGRDPLPNEERVPGLYQSMRTPGIFPEHCQPWLPLWMGKDTLHYTPEFNDYAAWAWDQWIKQTGKFVRGIYMDDNFLYEQFQPNGPCSYTLPDGHVQPGFQFRGWRERTKRLLKICWENGIPPKLIAHCTGTLTPVYHGFFSQILGGEHYPKGWSKEDFFDIWPLDYLRFRNQEKWGPRCIWLGPIHSFKEPGYEGWLFRKTRAWCAGLAMHDIQWPFNKKTVDDFGLLNEDVEFIPYWEKETAAPASNDETIKVVAWKRPGKALLLIVNTGDDRKDLTIKPNLVRLGFKQDDKLAVQDVDPDLLTYFDNDVSKARDISVKLTDGTGNTAATGENDILEELETKPEDLPLSERRKRDPDGKFSWKDGMLKCPVRRRDYRLFQLEKK